jgi:hypothetical protein
MGFVLIDYSELHYASLKSNKVPPKRTGKFIQIRHFETEYLLLSPIELSPYHANIAGRFFSREHIKGRFNKKQDHFEVLDPEWEVVGGGMWSINEKEKLLGLSGSSQAYGKYDRRGLREKILGVNGFEGYCVSAE